jgi:hypothetical protein
VGERSMQNQVSAARQKKQCPVYFRLVRNSSLVEKGVFPAARDTLYRTEYWMQNQVVPPRVLGGAGHVPGWQPVLIDGQKM